MAIVWYVVEYESPVAFDDEVDDHDEAVLRVDKRTRPCVRCADAQATFLLGRLRNGDLEELCRHCAGMEVGEKVTHPLSALRSHLLAMGLVEQVRRAPVLGDELRAEAADIRVRALNKLHDQLGSWAEVARRSGLSEARVANVATGRDRERRRGTRRERLFGPSRPPS